MWTFVENGFGSLTNENRNQGCTWGCRSEVAEKSMTKQAPEVSGNHGKHIGASTPFQEFNKLSWRGNLNVKQCFRGNTWLRVWVRKTVWTEIRGTWDIRLRGTRAHVQSSVAGVELGRAQAGEQEMNRPGGKLPQRLLRGGDVILKVTKMKSLQV